jgi:hypothetical protein
MTILRTDIPFPDRDRPVITIATDRSERRLPVQAWLPGSRSLTGFVLVLMLVLVTGVGAVQAQAKDDEEDVSLLQDAVSPDMVLPSDAEADETAADAPGMLVEPEEVFARESVSPEFIEEVSARAADGLRVQDFVLEEMPAEISSGKWFSSGQWYGSAEVLMMSRSRNYRRVMGYDPSVVGILPANRGLAGSFVTTGIPWDLVPGARLTIGEHLGRDDLDRDQSVEFTYYGGLSFFVRDSYNARPNSFLVTPLAGTILPGLPGFTGAQTYDSTIGSNYNSLELNYKLDRRLGRDQLIMSPNGGWSRHAERGWLPAVLIGTRVASVNETFTFASSRPGVSRSAYSGTYDIQTQNILWGLNLGGELISQNEHYYWGLRGRVTPAVSFASNQQQAAGVNTLPPPPSVAQVARGAFSWRQAADQVGPGFLGDLTILGGWQVTPNFAVQVGYDFLWVAGIATATRQFNLDNVRPNSIDGGGQVFYNGLSMGVEGSW